VRKDRGNCLISKSRKERAKRFRLAPFLSLKVPEGFLEKLLNVFPKTSKCFFRIGRINVIASGASLKQSPSCNEETPVSGAQLPVLKRGSTVLIWSERTSSAVSAPSVLVFSQKLPKSPSSTILPFASSLGTMVRKEFDRSDDVCGGEGGHLRSLLCLDLDTSWLGLCFAMLLIK